MDKDHARRFGRYLRRNREAKGLSTHGLAELSGITQSTVVRFERGEMSNPDPRKLRRLAEAIGLDPGEVLAAADLPIPTELLSPTTYLRTKYRNLPEDQVQSLQREVAAVLRRHGIDPQAVPMPGEDEQPESGDKFKTTRSTPTTKTKKGGTS